MRNGGIFNFPQRSMAEVFLSSIRQRLRDAVTDIGPIESLSVVMSPTTAAVLGKARNLRNLRELRDWLGVKDVITYCEVMDGTVIIGRDDVSQRFWRMFDG